MNLREYQIKTRKTEIYTSDKQKEICIYLGAIEEVGEIAGKIKKVYRDNNGVFDENVCFNIALELGDVCWYIAKQADFFNLRLPVLPNDEDLKRYSCYNQKKDLPYLVSFLAMNVNYIIKANIVVIFALISQLANVIGTTLERVLDLNYFKLTTRMERGTIQGEGDRR